MDTAAILNLILSTAYYIIVIILTFFSAFGVYILLRYGRTIPLSLAVAIVYILFFMKILAETYQTLHTIIG